MGGKKPQWKSEVSVLCFPCCIAEKGIMAEKPAQGRGLPKVVLP